MLEMSATDKPPSNPNLSLLYDEMVSSTWEEEPDLPEPVLRGPMD